MHDTLGNSVGVSFAASAATRGRAHGDPARQPVSLETVVRASPVFVVGCFRSGTTLVQTILDSHPRLSVSYEANFLVDIPLGRRSCMASAPAALTSAEAHPTFRAESFDTWGAREACGELGITDAAGAMRVLGGSLALAQGKRRWGTKTPNALLRLAELAAVYPDAQFIHVIRDGRDSASSQARIDRSLVQGALLWRAGIRNGRRVGPLLGPERYLEVRLEELLSSPEEQMRRMCAFLGENFEPSLRHFHTTARERIPSSDLSIHPRLGQPPRPLPPSRDGVATALVQRAATALINAELVELGYVPASPSGRPGRIVYPVIGYIVFLASLWRSIPDLYRHFTHYVGAIRAARGVTASPSSDRSSSDRSKEPPCPDEPPRPLLPRPGRSRD